MLDHSGWADGRTGGRAGGFQKHGFVGLSGVVEEKWSNRFEYSSGREVYYL